jgi:AbiV family abortive infection protein
MKKRDVEAINRVIKACIANADQLLSAAKEIRKPRRNHIAYHLAALALEEIGKATMITMGSLTPEPMLADDEHRSPAECYRES